MYEKLFIKKKETHYVQEKAKRIFFFGGHKRAFSTHLLHYFFFLSVTFFPPFSLIVWHHTIFLEWPPFCNRKKKITIFILYLIPRPPPKQETSWQRSSIFHRYHKSLSYPRHYPLRIFAPTSIPLIHIYLWNNSLHFYAVWITCLYLFQAVPFRDYGSPTWHYFLLPTPIQ